MSDVIITKVKIHFRNRKQEERATLFIQLQIQLIMR